MYSKQQKAAQTPANAHDVLAVNQFAARPFVVQPAVEKSTPQSEQTTSLQAKSGVLDPSVFRYVPPQRPPRVQMKRTISQPEATPEAQANKTGMPDHLKAGVENLSGVAMDDVKVHYNSPKPSQIQALAYTQGTDIHVGPGQEQHLAHEAWHVIQQKQGRVQPTLQAKGQDINDDQGLEQEADLMGAKVTQTPSDQSIKGINLIQKSSTPSGVIQRVVNHDAPNYTPKNGRAGSVEVENIWGTPYGPSANSPSIDVFGWPELYTAGHTLANPNANNSHYNAVRMHLWNGRLAGPGDDAKNLAPGPATINSSMSAGPETSAKDAVANKGTIWLKTEVWYQNSTGVANDFTSVVPNRMKMDWGYMLATNGKLAKNGAGVTKGPAEAPAWDVNIDQPAGSLTTTRQAEYRGLTDADTVNLDTMLTGTSNQEKAQAYGLVTPALKKHILLKYDIIYVGMADTERTNTLNSLNGLEIINLITLLGISADHRMIVNEVLQNLYASRPQLKAVFAQFTPAAQKELLQYGGLNLLVALEEKGENIAKTDWHIFKIYDETRKFALLNTMLRSEISELLNDEVKVDLFNRWANFNGHTTADDKYNFIRTKVNIEMSTKYNRALRFERREEQYQAAVSDGGVRTSGRRRYNRDPY
jgi:hypothetical protein